MTYVDQIKAWPTPIKCFQSGSCHLFADTLDELHVMAAAIGMRLEWFQPRAGFPHYDLTIKRRARAVRLGAIEVTSRELVMFVRGERPKREKQSDLFK